MTRVARADQPEQTAQRDDQKVALPDDQRISAAVLGLAGWGALAVLLVTFVIYLFLAQGSHLAPAQAPKYWSMPLEQYRQQTGQEMGWGWIARLPGAEVLPNLGMGLLALVPMLGYLALLPDYILRRRLPLVAIVVLELGLMVLAASGIVSGGH